MAEMVSFIGSSHYEPRSARKLVRVQPSLWGDFELTCNKYFRGRRPGDVIELNIRCLVDYCDKEFRGMPLQSMPLDLPEQIIESTAKKVMQHLNANKPHLWTSSNS